MEGQIENMAAHSIRQGSRQSPQRSPVSVLTGAPVGRGGGGERPSSGVPPSPGAFLPNSSACVPMATPHHNASSLCSLCQLPMSVTGPPPSFTGTTPCATMTAPQQQHVSGPVEIVGARNQTRVQAQGTPQASQECTQAGASQGRPEQGRGLGGEAPLWDGHRVLSRSVGAFLECDESGGTGAGGVVAPWGSVERRPSLSFPVLRGAPGEEDAELAELERKLQLLELKRRVSAERCEAFLEELEEHQEAEKTGAERSASRRSTARLAFAPACAQGTGSQWGKHQDVPFPVPRPSSTRPSRGRTDKIRYASMPLGLVVGQGGARPRSHSFKEHRARRAAEGNETGGGTGQFLSPVPPVFPVVPAPVCPLPAAEASLASGVPGPALPDRFQESVRIGWGGEQEGMPVPGKRAVLPVPKHGLKRVGPASCGSIPLARCGEVTGWHQGQASPVSPSVMETHLYYHSGGKANVHGFR